jgi:hypothetical protein
MSVSQNSLAEGQSAEQHSFAFRISLAASIGFTLGYLLGWEFPFLPSLLAVQLLSGHRSLDVKYAVGFVALMAAGCIFSLLIARIFIDKPADLALVIGLLIFLEFLALARGKAAAGVLLITTSFVPLMALSSLELAHALVHDLIVGSILAVLLTFLSHAMFPARLPEQALTKTVEESIPVRAALANTAVLMSLFVYFMGSGTPTSIIVIMTTAITILQQSAIAGKGAALGLFMGNVVGGFAASVAYLLISLLPSPAFLFLVVFLFGLLFGAKIAEGADMAPIYTVATATFLVVLGLGLSPLPQDSGTVFLSRVWTVAVASLYTVGVASVLRALFLESIATSARSP